MAFTRTRCGAAFAVFSATFVLTSLQPALAETPPPGKPVVVELFTSQGCSSCPPADELLGELASKPNVIALGFHVDYWNSIGWRDPYSLPKATTRQQGYVDALRLSTAFTPQIVINGRRSLVGSDRRGVATALAETPGAVNVEAAVVGDQLVISLPEAEDRRRYDINIIAYLPQSTTRIGGGENAGRTLTEFNVVRQFRQLGSWDGNARTLSVAVQSLPTDARRVAILVQQSHEGPIAGAVLVSLDKAVETK